MSKTTTVSQKHEAHSGRERWQEIIVKVDPSAGKLFDVLLLIVMSESVGSIREANPKLLVRAE